MLKMTPRAIEVANRRASGSRLAAATRAIKAMKNTCGLVLSNGQLQFTKKQKHKIGDCMIDVLRSKGMVMESETGFTRSSWRTYSNILKNHLKWITITGVGIEREIVWCGPDSAYWSDVVKALVSSRLAHKE